MKIRTLAYTFTLLTAATAFANAQNNSPGGRSAPTQRKAEPSEWKADPFVFMYSTDELTWGFAGASLKDNKIGWGLTLASDHPAGVIGISKHSDASDWSTTYPQIRSSETELFSIGFHLTYTVQQAYGFYAGVALTQATAFVEAKRSTSTTYDWYEVTSANGWDPVGGVYWVPKSVKPLAIQLGFQGSRLQFGIGWN